MPPKKNIFDRYKVYKEPNRKIQGFTLIELLVVIAIISLLVSILLPSLNTARELARKTVCSTQMRGYGTVTLMHTNETNDVLPYYDDYNVSNYSSHWITVLGQYMGGPAISEDDSVADGYEKYLVNNNLPARNCPSDKDCYIGVSYGGSTLYTDCGPFVYYSETNDSSRPYYPSPVSISDVSDPAGWIAFTDTKSDLVYSLALGRPNQDRDADGLADSCSTFGLLYNNGYPNVHRNGCNICLLDGHVEFISFEEWLDPDNGYWAD